MTVYIFLFIDFLCILFMIRNHMVYEFRRKLLGKIAEIAREDLALKYLAEMIIVKYDDMLWLFWKPLKSFYSEEILKLLE